MPTTYGIAIRHVGGCVTAERAAASRTGSNDGACKFMKNQMVSRRTLLRAFAATSIAAAPVCANAFGFLRGAGDVRKLKMHNGRTGESIDMVYWVDGDYIRPALDEISFFMRDWRSNSAHPIDPRNVDIMAAAHRLLDTSDPYILLSGYRSPETNAMLRARSSGVARNSLHMQGQAAALR